RSRSLAGSGLGVAALVGVSVFTGWSHVEEVNGRLHSTPRIAARTLPLVVVQGNIDQNAKNERREQDVANFILDRHLQLTTEALTALADERLDPLAVLWPETMVPFPFL